MTDTDKSVKLAFVIIILFVAVGMFRHLYSGVRQVPSSVSASEEEPSSEVLPTPLEEADTADMGPPVEYAPMSVQVQIHQEELESEVQVMQGVIDELGDKLRNPIKPLSLPKGYTPQL